MKKYTGYKTIQLILLVILAAGAIFLVFRNEDVYHQVAIDPTMKLMATALWIVLGLSFLFVFLDYTFFFGYRKEYREMEYAARSDPMSGIANRFSCDMVIEKYMDKPVPADLGCIMLEITNIQETNRLYGHLAGNMLISDFSSILRISSESLCFVGRNGGNKFLAFFENCDDDAMSKFMDRVSQRIGMYNSEIKNNPIQYSFGKSYSKEDKVENVTSLVALANSRIKSAV